MFGIGMPELIIILVNEIEFSIYVLGIMVPNINPLAVRHPQNRALLKRRLGEDIKRNPCLRSFISSSF